MIYITQSNWKPVMFHIGGPTLPHYVHRDVKFVYNIYMTTRDFLKVIYSYYEEYSWLPTYTNTF